MSLLSEAKNELNIFLLRGKTLTNNIDFNTKKE